MRALARAGHLWKQWVRVPAYSLLTIVSAALQAVAFKRAGYSLRPFPMLILLVVSFAFVPIFFAATLCIRLFYKRKFEGDTTTWSFIAAKFGLLGLLSAANGILILFSNPYVSGIDQALLSQSNIPLTILLSVAYLQACYTRRQYFGALVVVIGVATGIWAESDQGASPRDSPSSSPFFVALFILSQLPAAFSSVYQERCFANAHVNVVQMMTYSNLFQFFALAVILLGPGSGLLAEHLSMGGATDAAAADYYQHLRDGWSCILYSRGGSPARSSLAQGALSSAAGKMLGHGEAYPPVHRYALEEHPECRHAALDLQLCVWTMLLCQVSQTLLVKFSSATLTVLVMTLITPASAACFTLPALMGREHVEAMSAGSVISLAILLVGILLYRFEDAGGIDEEHKDALRQESTATDDCRKGLLAGSPPPEADGTGGYDRCTTDGSVPGKADSRPHAHRPKPVLMQSRCGIVSSEYTGGGFSSGWRCHECSEVDILLEWTCPACGATR